MRVRNRSLPGQRRVKPGNIRLSMGMRSRSLPGQRRVQIGNVRLRMRVQSGSIHAGMIVIGGSLASERRVNIRLVIIPRQRLSQFRFRHNISIMRIQISFNRRVNILWLDGCAFRNLFHVILESRHRLRQLAVVFPGSRCHEYFVKCNRFHQITLLC